jgi:hypothetical protein
VEAPALTRAEPTLTRWLWAVALAALALRVWIGATFPITGDEAYFYAWGRRPEWGYYDHPPMVGWWIALMLQWFGDSTWSMRIPAIVLPLALGALLGWGVSAIDRARAPWVVLLFWLAPIHWLNALITTDTPLIFWSLASAAVLLHANASTDASRAARLHALSGLLLGLAFLSKYFAVVLGLAYAVYFAVWRRDRWSHFALLVLCALPGPLINLGWNMGHGWANIMFNVFNRNEGEAFSWDKPGLYVLMWLYLLTPGLAWLAWQQRRVWWAGLRQQPLLLCLVVVPMGFFALLSFKKVVGLHWVLNFYPFVFAAFALFVPVNALQRARQWLLGFTLLHVVAVAGLYTTQLSDWRDSGLYTQIVRSYRTQALLDQVRSDNTVLMATAYTPASIYGQTLKTYVPVFGVGSFHARQDDLWVDFRAYQGRTLRIIDSHDMALSDYAPFFTSVRAFDVTQDGAVFHVIEGQGFQFEVYRDKVLRQIYAQRHQIPAWLPMTGCAFCERFCGALRCDARAP